MTTTTPNPVQEAPASLVRRLAADVSELLTDRAVDRTADSADQDRVRGRKLIHDQLAALARDRLTHGLDPLAEELEDEIAERVYERLFGFSGFQRYLDDDSVENIHANGFDNVWVVRADGSREPGHPVADSDADLIDLVRQFAARSGRTERRFDSGCPYLDLRLPDGSRLFAVMEVSGRPCVSIRRHRHTTPTLEQLMDLGTIDQGLWSFLSAAVRARFNLVVAGGTDAGKTTLLRALVNEIHPLERLVVIEDSLELNLSANPDLHPNIVEYEVRQANVEGQGAVTMRELTRWGLRMAPDRVIVGEVRGGEVIDMLLAMSQGNDGSLCTIHAESSAGAFSKIAMYALMAPERLSPEATNLLIANSVHFVVHIHKLGDGTRAVSSVREVCGAEDLQVHSNEVFAPGADGRARPATPLRQRTLDRLVAAGFHATIMQNGNGWWQ